jgi:hypothetical protein
MFGIAEKETTQPEVVASPEQVLKEITSLKFDSLSRNQLTAYGEKASSAILEKINQSAERIALAKRRASDAESMKTGIFGGTAKKTDATATAVVATNEAVHEMNELMRALIVYTQLNSKLSKVMNGAMARMMAEGFKDRDGHLVELNQNGEDFANIVMQEAEDFSTRQLEVENMQSEQSAKIEDINKQSLKRSQENENKISELKRIAQSEVKRNRANIDANKSIIDENKFDIDANSSSIESNKSKIDENSTNIQTVLSRANQNHKMQVGNIKLLQEGMKKQQERIASLEEKHAKAERTYMIANSAIVLAIISISLTVWLLTKIDLVNIL